VVPAFDIVCGECWFCRRGETALCDRFRNLGAGTAAGGLGGTHAERVRVPAGDQNLLRIPDALEDQRALFLGDILTTAVYAASSARIREGDTVAVIGAGPVGLLCAQAARLHGPAEVLVLDVDAERLALAETMGAVPIDVAKRNAETATDERTDGRGADVVIEAVGSVPAFESALHVVRRGGTVCVVGMYTVETTELSLGRAWLKGLKLIFAGICPIHAWWDRAMRSVQEGAIDPLPLISHTLPLEEAPKGYDLFDRREAIKVLLTP
jgi:threonine dehydrogenase-like Zn-dependent dehydrogenase